MTRRRSGLLPAFSSSAFAGFRFPPEIIVRAVRWYLRYGLSYRDVEELGVDARARCRVAAAFTELARTI